MTHKTELIEGLQKLMKLDAIKRSKMGRVFEIYDALVELRDSGVRAADIELLLNDPAGVYKFDLPPGSLTSYMHRIKLKKAASRADRRLPVAEPAVLTKAKKPSKPKAPAAPVVLESKVSKITPATAVKNALSQTTDFSEFNVD